MPARTVVNASDVDVTIATVTAKKRSVQTLTIVDTDLATWVGTAGIAVLANGADYQSRRDISRRLRYNIVGETIG